MSNDDWKPDFTADDPWAGMPSDYGGVATFVPTEDTPGPPWEGDTSSVPAFGTPAYAATAVQIVQEWAATLNDPKSTSAAKAEATRLLEAAQRAEAAGAGVAALPGGKPLVPVPVVKPLAVATAFDWQKYLPWLAVGAVGLMILSKQKR